MRVQKCKGSRDLSPAEMARFRTVESAFRAGCARWGYEEVRTPTLEYLHLFTSVGTLTPGMLGKVYSFLDWNGWSGERVVLRPDGTIPVARYYIEDRAEKAVARLCYVANVFMFEETGEKDRERWQCGAELIGVSSPLADAELIALAMEVLKKLDLKCLELRLSHAGLIRALISSLGLNDEEQTSVLDQILDGNIDVLARIRPGKPELARALASLLDLRGKAPGFLHNIKALFVRDMPQLVAPVDNFIATVDLLEMLGCDYQIDITSGRGFEYYTGVMFRILADGEHIGGGGRYDDLIPLMGGKKTPASGFALYVDRIMGKLAPETAKSQTPGVLVKVDATSPETVSTAMDIVRGLHEQGFVARLDLGEPTPDLGWTLDMTESPFVLANRLDKRRFTINNVADVLAVLGEEDARPNRSA
ncbi:MAG: histidine--tRNA ligase family protein [Chloroflexi bacterium]|nr:histidine--tRNA ligase family protein [Chloroflexota bacterium]